MSIESYVGIALFVLVPIGLGIFDLFRRSYLVPGIIAGNVNEPVDLPTKRVYSLTNYKIDGETVRGKDFHFVGYMVNNSLTQLGFPDGRIVFCEKVTPDDVRREDVLILETHAEPNRGKPKGRLCLGRWGKPDEPDDDLKRIEGYDGPVEEYFKNVAPETYGYVSYTEQIEDFFKTLSGDQDSEKLRISRPHDPRALIARVKYAL